MSAIPDFERAVDIAAPPGVVWGVMSEAERWHEWTASVRSIRLLDSGPMRVGARAIVKQPRFPPALWKVIALEPGRSFTWKSGLPGMWVYASHRVDGSGTGSRVVLSLRYEGPIGKLLARLTRDITNRYLDLEATGLKRRSEERAAH